MSAVDTNLLIDAAMYDVPEHERAHARLRARARGTRPWFATWGTPDEFLRVATHRGAYAHPPTFDQAAAFVAESHRSPTFEVLVETDRHPAVLAELTREYPSLTGSIMHDLRAVALMREHGVRDIHTANADFRRFRELRVVNPLAG